MNFELDESYTPTKLVFLAGMGGNDLVEFAGWDSPGSIGDDQAGGNQGEPPVGWVDIGLEGVGGRNGGYVTRSGSGSGSRERRERSRRRSSARERESERTQTQTGRKGILKGGAGGNVGEEDDESDGDEYAGNVLKAMVVQMRVVENHQNGKDTHVRGFQVFAKDEDRRRVGISASAHAGERRRSRKSLRKEDEGGGAPGKMSEPDWMGEPIIR